MWYARKKKYAHLGMSQLRRLRQVKDENSRFKGIPDHVLSIRGFGCCCGVRSGGSIVSGCGA
jgi:hypothetical protein